MGLQTSRQSVSPIQSLPRDVLSLIFHRCLSSIHDDDEETVPATTPITLALVSKQWKEIVWSSVELWTSLSLSNIVHKDHINSWFARAGSELPLSLRIRHKSSLEQPRLDFVALGDVLLKYADRFEHLHLTLTTRCWGSLSLTHFRPTRLRSFKIFGEGTLRRIIDPIDLTASPQLSDLAIANTFPRFLQVNWNALKKLTLDTMLMKEMTEMLSQSTGLAHLVVRNPILEDSWVEPRSGAGKLPHLQTLDWMEKGRRWETEITWDFLDIQTPRLKTFRFVTEGRIGARLPLWVEKRSSLSLVVLGECGAKDGELQLRVTPQMVVLTQEKAKKFLDSPSSLPSLDATEESNRGNGAVWAKTY